MSSEVWGYCTWKAVGHTRVCQRKNCDEMWTRCRCLAGGSWVVHPAGPPYHCATLITIFAYTNQLNKASTIYWMYFCLALLVGLARFTAVLNYVNYCKMCRPRKCLPTRAATGFQIQYILCVANMEHYTYKINSTRYLALNFETSKRCSGLKYIGTQVFIEIINLSQFHIATIQYV